MEGYIKLSRKFFSNPLWQEPREYSKAEAWIDMIQFARFEAGEAKIVIGNKIIDIHYGEFPASIRFLAKRWGWSKNKVCRFFDMLEDEKMITKRTVNGTKQTLVSLCNFGIYNSNNSLNGTTSGTVAGQYRDNTGTKNKKDKNIITPLSTYVDIPPKISDSETPEHEKTVTATVTLSKSEEKEKNCAKREKEFYDQLVPYVAIYGSTMIRSFFDYWSEKNKSRSKMRFELQPTWDLAKRLKTWENKQKEYEKRNSKGGCGPERSDESLMRHIAAGYARGMEELKRRER